MTKKIKQRVITKENAVFWLDKNGRWNNKHGEFQHKKIIQFFNTSIKKDQNGYYLGQMIGNIKEKVYFYYEDCVLFAVDLIIESKIRLVLNNKKQIVLMPRKLSVENDSLYMDYKGERIKFIERGLTKISDILIFQDDLFFVRVGNRKYKIPQDPDK